MIVATISTNNYQRDKERLDEYCIKDKVEIKIFKPKETVKSKRLRSYWAAQLEPFVEIRKDDKPVKCFWAEEGMDPIDRLVDFLEKELQE